MKRIGVKIELYDSSTNKIIKTLQTTLDPTRTKTSLEIKGDVLDWMEKVDDRELHSEVKI